MRSSLYKNGTREGTKSNLKNLFKVGYLIFETSDLLRNILKINWGR